MRFPASIYCGDQGRQYLAVYCDYPDIFLKLHRNHNAERVAHVSYGDRDKRKGIDLFLLEKGLEQDQNSSYVLKVFARLGRNYIVNEKPRRGLPARTHEMFYSDQDASQTAVKNDVSMTIRQDLQTTELEDEITGFSLMDIEMFAGSRPAKELQGPRIDYEKQIIPVTKLAKIRPEGQLIIPGKPEFVRECILRGSLDLVGGCYAEWTGDKPCNFDSSQRANIVYESMRQVASSIDLSLLALMPPKEILKAFKPYMKKMGDPERTLLDPIRIAHYNARKLQEEYAGDPRNLKGRSIDQTIHNICFGKAKKSKHKFHQYGIGKAALLLKNYVRFGIWDFSEYQIPIKVDRHLLRIAIGSEVLTLPEDVTRGRVDKIVDVLTDLFRKVTSKEKISAVDLNDSFWAIGSYLCTKNDAIHCHFSCGVNCSKRPVLDKKVSWIAPATEHRDNCHNLFRWAEEQSMP